eukprot:COSAG02_NODE_3850_length_6147_cov_7.419478_13_plen_66_part_00
MHSLSALPVHHERAGDAEQHQRRPGLHSTPSQVYSDAHTTDNILPRNAGFTGVRDVVWSSLYITE